MLTEAERFELPFRLAIAVREIALARPNVKYISELPLFPETSFGCYYDDRGRCSDGSCGCLFGQGFKQIGVDFKAFNEQFGDAITQNICVNGILQGVLGEFIDFQSQDPDQLEAAGLYREILRWVEEVQSQQDNGLPWSDCVAWADSVTGQIQGVHFG